MATFWLSYDLGVGGDYPSLYQWLDDRQALVCGNGIAFFKMDDPENKGFDLLKKELEEHVDLKPGNVLYAIGKDENGKIMGRFLYGKRKAAPWVGFGSAAQEEDS